MPYICAVSGCFHQRGKNSVDAEGKPINYFAFPSPIAQKERYDKFSELCRLQQNCDGLNSRHKTQPEPRFFVHNWSIWPTCIMYMHISVVLLNTHMYS